MPDFINDPCLALKYSNMVNVTLFVHNRCQEEVEETKIIKVIQT
jgi:hypothetical protein